MFDDHKELSDIYERTKITATAHRDNIDIEKSARKVHSKEAVSEGLLEFKIEIARLKMELEQEVKSYHTGWAEAHPGSGLANSVTLVKGLDAATARNGAQSSTEVRRALYDTQKAGILRDDLQEAFEDAFQDSNSKKLHLAQGILKDLDAYPQAFQGLLANALKTKSPHERKLDASIDEIVNQAFGVR